ncbi:MAG: betaine-aldehyde dehydrogenase [Pirellulaceae bacterium]|nr:betaine-aldehyde dehydrogenase [Pirellulaceae bacterium]
MISLKTQQSFINGTSRPSSAGESLITYYPATNEAICDVELSLDAEVNAAVESAIAAQKSWRAMTGTQRGRILHRAADLLRQRNDELAMLEVYDTGKPISEAGSVDVQSGADALEYFAGIAPTIKGEHYRLGKNYAYTIREPLGVVAGIGAWNYPLQIACWKAAPALAAGNAMIFKPSELTPLTALELARTFRDAGLPDGLFNVVLGDHRTGQLLVEHPGIEKVSLTGGVETGRRIMAAAASQLKHLTLELGGKSPLLIFDDANIENAVKATLLANFFTQGEICSNGTRVFVHDNVRRPFLEQLKTATQQLVIGDPLDPKTEIGSLISPEHCQSVLDYIAKGKQEGADLVCGGNQVGERGNFVQPTIFSECRDEMTIVQEEIFGPVLSLLSFSDEDEVIARANATDFGLAAGVFTNDLSRADRVISQIQAGTCWINTYNITPIEIPFGGYKQSGIGRENSEWAIQHYTQLKTVYVETGDL